MTIYTDARNELEAGNEDKAWEIASQDETLLPHVTKEQWITHTKKALADTEAQNKVNAHFALMLNV